MLQEPKADVRSGDGGLDSHSRTILPGASGAA